MGFMLARIQVRYGQVQRLVDVMPAIVAGMEAQGWQLLGAWQTRIGPFHEVWDLWDVGGDASAIDRGLEGARSDPAFLAAGKQLADIIEHEEIRYLESLPYAHGGSSAG